MNNQTNNSSKAFIIIAVILVAVIAIAAAAYNLLTKNTNSGLVPMQSDTADSTDTVRSGTDTENSTEADSGGQKYGKESNTGKEFAPDFTVEDLSGNKHKLSDFRGKPVIINFWASWCGPCKSEMPDFEELYREYGTEIHFLMVNMTDGQRETKEKAKAHIDTEGYTFPVYFDTESEAAYAYGVSSIPATHFIDAQGYHIAYGVGALDKETLMKGIEMLPDFEE